MSPALLTRMFDVGGILHQADDIPKERKVDERAVASMVGADRRRYAVPSVDRPRYQAANPQMTAFSAKASAAPRANALVRLLSGAFAAQMRSRIIVDWRCLFGGGVASTEPPPLSGSTLQCSVAPAR